MVNTETIAWHPWDMLKLTRREAGELLLSHGTASVGHVLLETAYKQKRAVGTAI